MYLVVENITKYYGSKKVLDNINIEIEKPMIYSLLGPNGAGKTTLMNIIVGVQKPSSGKVLVKGLKPDDPKTRSLIGYCPQEPALYERLTGWDNIMFYAKLYNVPAGEARRRAKELLELLDMEKYARMRVARYSGGMKKKLALITSLIHDPEIIVLDEPTTGMDPGIRRSVWDLLLKLRREGKVLLLATHYMEEADQLSDMVGIIDQGKLLVEGPPEVLKRKYGPPSVVVVQLTSKPSEELLNAIREVSSEYYVEDNVLKIHVNNPDKAVPKLINTIYETGSRIELLKITRPTLEDVFLKLTGRRLE